MTKVEPKSHFALTTETIAGANSARDRFKLVVKTLIDDGTTWNLSKLFKISPTFSLTRTPRWGTNFITTYTLDSEWFHVKEDTMLSVYWTPLRHSLMSCACCATRRHNTIWQFSSHLNPIKYIPVIFIPEWTMPITAKLHLDFGSWMHRKITSLHRSRR